MTDVAEYLMKFVEELEQLVPNRGTRHMISTTEDGKIEIRIGAGDWYRIWFRQLDLAPFDGLIWPHLKACDLLFRAGLG